ncbi:hypothetical protein L1887_06986 [Cichorium endivia]|nr:hypothetical protein L1887_06986 [Cichorium endivia]
MEQKCSLRVYYSMLVYEGWMRLRLGRRYPIWCSGWRYQEDGCMERSMKEFLRDYVLSLVGVAVSYAILVEFFMIKEEIVDRFEPEEESW